MVTRIKPDVIYKDLDFFQGKDVVLAINPGSTSSKIGVGTKINSKIMIYEEDLEVETINDFSKGWKIICEKIKVFLQKNKIKSIVGVCGRGGIIKPTSWGLIHINDGCVIDKDLLTDTLVHPEMDHESNMGAMIAANIAEEYKVEAYILDPPTTYAYSDNPLARLTGIRGRERRSIWHALNCNAVLRAFGRHLGNNEPNVIIVHIGGGITVAAYRKGKIVDVTNALGEGPFSSRRGITQYADGIVDIIRMVRKGNSLESIMAKYMRFGGISSYLGTKDLRDVEDMIKVNDENIQIDIDELLNCKGFEKGIISKRNTTALDDKKFRSAIKGLAAKRVLEGMAYQIAKYSQAMKVPIDGPLDGIVFTGGGANSKVLIDMIKDKLGEPIFILPGSLEQYAMIDQTFKAYEGELKSAKYKPIHKYPSKIKDQFGLMDFDLAFKKPKSIYLISHLEDLLIEAKKIKTKPNMVCIRADKHSRTAIEICDHLLGEVVFTDDISEGVDLLEKKKTDLLLKGEEISTGQFLKPVLNKIQCKVKRVSSATAVEILVDFKKKLIIFTDAGINASISEPVLVEEIKNAVFMAQLLGIGKNKVPKVAILSASEHVSDKIEWSRASRKFSELNWPVIVDGPISYDIALSPRIAENKKFHGKIKGDADILVCTSINSANLLYKILTISQERPVANGVIGLPVVVTSRGDTALSKAYSIALSILLLDSY